jgi:diacylglycerol kinase family enzyme
MLGRKTPAFISRYGAGARISIEAGRAFPVQADGDFRGYFSHLHVSVEPRAVRILAPRRFQNLA